ncbi:MULTISPECIES: ribbon-helix-helix domain-containing protein [Pseudomonas]|uniref:Ribbon-helix-helix domain-containing protein n=1 Tax=Pseudomonas quercus TaxID=2722792 RepID=A0ABX0YD91_9PSED|nr:MULTISPECIES: ribbon-helix-helix domain-containing protein [Pseudomonas]MBF7141652.1 ribbon-helix-helix domain-containing protein [Pseudomonas sp. LY10J]NJP00191.1 ribbon-helix-helix domain-containing protein [Pseudomonas quercus]
MSMECSRFDRGCSAAKLLLDPFQKDFNMALARPTARSVRLNGFATCLRLEQVYWNILQSLADRNGCTVSQLLSYLDREVHLRYGGVKNFSGLVRVVCVAYALSEHNAGMPADA